MASRENHQVGGSQLGQRLPRVDLGALLALIRQDCQVSKSGYRRSIGAQGRLWQLARISKSQSLGVGGTIGASNPRLIGPSRHHRPTRYTCQAG